MAVAHPLQPRRLPETRLPQSEQDSHDIRWRSTVAKEDRGFASMDRAKQREIASKGGKAAHQKGTAHEWTSEEAREAGRKGGMASHRRKLQSRDESRSTEGSADDTTNKETNYE